MSNGTIFVFIDLEMTGLDVKKHRIIEFAMILTDTSMNELDRYSTVVHQSDSVLLNMSEWCVDQFKGPEGLAKNSRDSSTTEKDVITTVIKKLSPYPGTKYLCGNSVHMDKYFLMEYMPEITDLLHYRIIDISTLKVLVEEWKPEVEAFKKQNSHRALDDIIESINELKHFRSKLFL